MGQAGVVTELPAPTFRYHPDPVATGQVCVSAVACRCCGQDRGWVYVGPVYGPATSDQLDDALCPWCIAEGFAAERFGVSFTDVGWGVPEGVQASVLAELSERTPGFTGWQQDHWLYHCDDATAYVGMADYARLQAHPNALEMLLHENDEFGWSTQNSEAWVESMSIDDSPTAYLFRCLHCGVDLAYADMD